MDGLLDMLEDILLQDDKVDLSMEELQCSLDTINDVIRLGYSLRLSILNIMASNYRDTLLENEIYYNTVYMSKLINKDSDANAFKASKASNANAIKASKKAIVQLPLIEKIGGYPTLKRGEKWPIVNGEHLTFIVQFKMPNGQDNILYRVFANIDDRMTNYYVLLPLVIKETNNYLKNVKLSYPNGKIIKEYMIQEWTTCRELKPFNNVCDIYRTYDDLNNVQVFEYAYDLILNTKKEIAEECIEGDIIDNIQSEIQLGISICDKIIDGKKVLFTIPAELIQKIEFSQSNNSKTYYFYEDESMQFI